VRGALWIGRALALGVVALAAWLSLTPKPPMIEGLPQDSDLVAHFLMHTGVAGALLLAWPPRRGVALAILTLAVALEVGQLAVTGRVFSLADMAANLVGAGMGATGAALARRWPRRLMSAVAQARNGAWATKGPGRGAGPSGSGHGAQ